MTARRLSLRWRVTLAMLVLAAVGSSIFALSVYVGAERLERTVLNRHVLAEFDTFAAQAHADPTLRDVKSALLSGYVAADNPHLPRELATLPAGGFHAVAIGDKTYQAYIGDEDGRRLYVAYDITEWEALEQPVIDILIAGVVTSSLLAIALGFWASAGIIAPVTALAARLRALDPRQRNVRIAAEIAGPEVGAIAESFDRYMERLDGFVEREQVFTSGAAHELRTPLAVIQGATEVLAEQRDLPAAALRAIGRLQRATREMREFIEALLFLSRENGRDGYGPASCDVGAIARQLADDYRRLAEGKPIEISAAADGALPLAVPPALPTIVIGNLLRNALEHTAAGRVAVTLEGRTLRIVDSGEGIAAEALPRIFDRDYSTKPGGGMGLHLTKRICDRFGWRLTIESGGQRGTTASVEFPA